MRKAIIAMSGGVDSSVAALLTKETGDECIGATMKLFHNEDIGVKREKTCCSLDDVEDARNVCYRMGIRYYVLTFPRGLKRMLWTALWMPMSMELRQIPALTAIVI